MLRQLPRQEVTTMLFLGIKKPLKLLIRFLTKRNTTKGKYRLADRLEEACVLSFLQDTRHKKTKKKKKKKKSYLVFIKPPLEITIRM